METSIISQTTYIHTFLKYMYSGLKRVYNKTYIQAPLNVEKKQSFRNPSKWIKYIIMHKTEIWQTSNKTNEEYSQKKVWESMAVNSGVLTEEC